MDVYDLRVWPDTLSYHFSPWVKWCRYVASFSNDQKSKTNKTNQTLRWGLFLESRFLKMYWILYNLEYGLVWCLKVSGPYV